MQSASPFTGTMSLSPTVPLGSSSDSVAAGQALTILKDSGALRQSPQRLTTQSVLSPVPSPALVSPARPSTPSSVVSTPLTGMSPLPLKVTPVGSTPRSQSLTSSLSPTNGMISGEQVVDNRVGTPVIVPPLTPTAVVKAPSPLSSPMRSLTPIGSSTPTPVGEKKEYTTYPLESEQSIEDFLTDKGYVQTGTVTMEGPGGGRLLYVKAEDPLGNDVLIDPNLRGRLSADLSTDVKVTAVEGTSVPSDLRMTVEECAENPSCGAAFECGQEFCVLKRDANAEDGFKQETYLLSATPSEETVTTVGKPLATPVLPLSQIQTSPVESVSYTLRSTNAIKAAAERNALAEIDAQLFTLQNAADRLREYRAAYADLLTARRAEEQFGRRLALQHRALMRNGTVTPENEAKLKAVTDRLRELNNTEEELLQHNRNLLSELKVPSEAIVDKTRDALFALFLKAKQKYDTKLSAALRDPTQWGLPAELKDDTYVELLEGSWAAKVPETENTKSLYRVTSSIKASSPMLETNNVLLETPAPANSLLASLTTPNGFATPNGELPQLG